MPLAVVVRLMNGQAIEVRMRSRSTVLHLKQRLCDCIGVPTGHQALLPGGPGVARELGDSEGLLSLAGWFVIGDLASADLVRHATFDISVGLVVTQKVCGWCGERARLKCSACLSTRYCSGECQRAYWPEHRHRDKC